MIEEYGLRYILGAKPGDHEFLFDNLASSKEAVYHEIRTEDGHYHQFRFQNDVPLNKSNQDLKVNVIEYRHTDPKGKVRNFSWITNIPVSTTNMMKIAIGGRARWKIENETFNAIKNLGYKFEQNYGHGKKYLSTVFCMLIMLAFLIDQVQELCSPLYKRCRKFARSYYNLWASMATLFQYVRLYDWERFFLTLTKKRPLDTP